MENGQMGQINGEMYAVAKMWFDLWKKSNRLSFHMCDSVRVWGQKTNRGEAHFQMWMHRCSFCLTQLFSIIHKYLSPARSWSSKTSNCDVGAFSMFAIVDATLAEQTVWKCFFWMCFLPFPGQDYVCLYNITRTVDLAEVARPQSYDWRLIYHICLLLIGDESYWFLDELSRHINPPSFWQNKLSHIFLFLSVDVFFQ